MASSYAALCNDFYINARLNLKTDLPMRRDTVLSLFDRIRRKHPALDRFKRYSNELALESRAADGAYDWIAVRRTSVRSGSVNPESDEQAHDLHRLILENAPFYLDITPLDVEDVEVLYGFDLLASGNHDSIVFNALAGDSPLASLVDGHDASPIEFQPLLGVSLNDHSDLQAYFEVKTRASGKRANPREDGEEPISVYVIVRRRGPFPDISEFPNIYQSLAEHAEEILTRRIVPKMLVPLREAIAAG